MPTPVLVLSAHRRHHVGVVRVAERRVYRGGRGEHVSGVAERRQVTHGHVTGQRGGAEGRVLVVQTFGKLLIAVAAPLVLFGFVGHFPVACLYSFLFHGQRPVHVVQFIVEAAGVAHWVSICIAPPKCSGGRLTVSTTGACSSGCRQSAFGFDEWSVLAVHLVVKAAGVAQIVSGAVTSPQRRRSGSTVHTLTALGAGPCLAFVLGGEAGRGAQQAARVEQAAAVLVGRLERVGGVCGYGVVGGWSLGAHGGQAAPQRAGALHLHALR